MSKQEFYPKAKATAKVWNCYNRCKRDCCSDIFMKLSEENKKRLLQKNEMVFDKDYTDWKWVAYHKGLIVENYGKDKLVIVDDDIVSEIHFNPHLDSEMVLFKTPCRMLKKDGKCRIFIARPEICRIAECPIFSDKEEVKWYAKHSNLKGIKIDSG